MKVLFLNPPHLAQQPYMKEIGRCGRKSVAGELWPQTGLAYLAAALLQAGHQTHIIDGIAESLTLSQLRERIAAFSPSLIVSNITTPTFNNDLEVLRQLKANDNLLIALTGTHPSALPRDTLATGIPDFILINEAEDTVVEVADTVTENLNHDKPWHSGFNHIKGIALRGEKGETIITEPRPYVEPLDRLPFPARHLLPNERYRMPFFEKSPFVTVIPTRGCPWKCIFCRAGKVWGSKVRTRSSENIIAEIEQITQQLNITKIVFMTDSLTLNRPWAKRFMQALIDAHLPIEWICNSRVDAVDEELLRLMKRAGCKLVSYGIESGSQAILDRARKQQKLDDCVQAIRLTRQAGIISMAYFILGLPGENQQTIQQTIDFMQQINPDYVNVHIATPFPGTEFYDICTQHNWLVSQNWDEYEEEGACVIRTEELSQEELLAAQRRAMRSFYLRPSRLLKELVRLRNFAELRAKLRAGRSVLKTLFSPTPTNPKT